MRTKPTLILGALLTGALFGAAHAETRLRPGDLAPDFSLPDTEGKTVTLAELTAKGPVVLAFFPKAFTGG
jgi:peroxiredoxin Q/BCP